MEILAQPLREFLSLVRGGATWGHGEQQLRIDSPTDPTKIDTFRVRFQDERVLLPGIYK
jgi:hypothetical protein